MPPEVETHLVNAVLTNGARYYVDHAHPELSTPECADALEAVLYDKAGEIVLMRSMVAAKRMLPEGESIVVYKNNSDRKGNSYGTHENYLMDRAVPFSRIAHLITPHFVTRQIYTGAGKVGTETPTLGGRTVPYQLSQRSEFFEEEIGLETTLKRPIVNTRDEPHADPQRYRRLHVIVGDANLAEVATFLKIGVTALVLALIEDDGFEGVDLDPRQPRSGHKARLVRHDLEHALEMADGTILHRPRGPVGAVLARPQVRRATGPRVPGGRGRRARRPRALGVRAPRTRDRSRQRGAPGRLGRQAAANRGLPGPPQPGLGRPPPRGARPSVPRSASRALLCSPASTPSTSSTEQDVLSAVTEPPRRTRAYFRGQCLKRWASSVASANWDSIVFDLGTDPLRRVPMMDPLRGTAEHTEELLKASSSPADLLTRLSA